MNYEILQGDVRERLKDLPDQSIQTVITSPPYWGLRDYGVEGQLGLETSPDAYVQGMMEVFREVRRVLADDGVLWLNLGDSAPGQTPNTGNRGLKVVDGKRNRRSVWTIPTQPFKGAHFATMPEEVGGAVHPRRESRRGYGVGPLRWKWDGGRGSHPSRTEVYRH